MKKKLFFRTIRKIINANYQQHAPSVTSKNLNDAYVFSQGYKKALSNFTEQPINISEYNELIIDESMKYLIESMNA